MANFEQCKATLSLPCRTRDLSNLERSVDDARLYNEFRRESARSALCAMLATVSGRVRQVRWLSQHNETMVKLGSTETLEFVVRGGKH